MKYKTVTPSTVFPIDTAFLKLQLRMTNSDMDTYLTSLIAAATQKANDFTGRQLNRATLMAYSFYKGELSYELERGPVDAVSKIEFIKEDGSSILLQSTDYTTIKEDLAAFIFITSPDLLTLVSRTRPDAVQITYTAGWTGATGSLFPEDIKNAVAMAAARMYTNPDDGVDEKASISDNLLRAYRCPII